MTTQQQKLFSWICCLLVGLTLECQAALTIYVSPEGSDDGAGTKFAPFQSLERARDAIRQIKKSRGLLPKGGFIVELLAGIYELDKPLVLTTEDSGTKGAPIVYRAQPGKKVRISGGKRITNFKKVTDAQVLAVVDAAARNSLVQADMKQLGIQDFGKLSERGFGCPVRTAHMELFFQDKPMILARWPNEGYVKIADLSGGAQSGQFKYSEERPKRWRQENDVWIYGYWYHDWADSYMSVETIDVQNQTLQMKNKPTYGLRKGQRWFALNLLSELDTPGEYYVDTKKGMLYFWPPASLQGGAAVVSATDRLISMKDTKYVTVQGMILEACRSTAITISGGDHNRIVDCVIRNTGNKAVTVSGADHTVSSCTIYETGDGGISLSGGDRKTLTPARLRAENNHIYNFSRWCHTYRPAVGVGGCGNIVRHNLIHHGPHNAIQLGGNDHTIEYNEIHHVCQDTGDVGAFYMGRDWTARGTVIRYNYWHHISGPGRLGAMGVYLDDQASGITIFGNIFFDVTRAVFIGGGCDNVVENNIFVDCTPSAHIDARGLGWQKKFTDDPKATLRTRLKSMPYRNPLWQKRYPNLANILTDDPGTPKRNRVTRNICVGGKWDDIHNGTRKYQIVENNLVDQNPHFLGSENQDFQLHPQKQDFQLKPTSPALKLGFQPIPIERIGLRKK